MLDALEPEPLAVTPAAQVHRGELDGSPVAVKVRRPGVERSVRNDVALLDGLAGPLAPRFPRLDAAGVLRDLRTLALDELDLEHEASQQRASPALCAGSTASRCPPPTASSRRETVLVSELLEGATLADRRAAARRAPRRAGARGRRTSPRLGAGLRLTTCARATSWSRRTARWGCSAPASRARSTATARRPGSPRWTRSPPATRTPSPRASRGRRACSARTRRAPRTPCCARCSTSCSRPTRRSTPPPCATWPSARAAARREIVRLAGRAAAGPEDLALGRTIGQLAAVVARF